MTPPAPGAGYDDRPWMVWHAVLVLASGIGGALVATAAVGPELTSKETWRLVLPAQTIVQILVVGALAVGSARRRRTLGPGFEPRDLIGIPIGIGLLVAGSWILTGISVLFLDGEPPTQEVVDSAAGAAGVDIALVVVFAGLLAPLAEELVFRGILLRALLERRGTGFATYVSAGAFAAIHLLDPQAWLVVPLLFLLGVVLGRQAVSTGRLARPFVIHATFNLVSVASLFAVG